MKKDKFEMNQTKHLSKTRGKRTPSTMSTASPEFEISNLAEPLPVKKGQSAITIDPGLTIIKRKNIRSTHFRKNKKISI